MGGFQFGGKPWHYQPSLSNSRCGTLAQTSIILERKGAVWRMTLNRPDKLNSFTRTMLTEIGDALTEIEADDEARALVITGAGRAFCAGQDLREAEAVEDGAAVRAVVERHYNPTIRLLRSLHIPVLAAVNGVAAGAGASFAVAADLVLAAQSASFSFPFSKIGLVPDAGASYFVPRLIGHARTLGLALLGESISAETAAQWGLIWQAVPDADFGTAVEAMAERLSRLPTAAVALMKQAISAGEHHSLEQQLALEAELQSRAADTEDFQEGVRAFLEKRGARFIGR
jgi:2-(1,2-epoxy-1,2-dihydrophenyl)acetyl-CoA isomerase